MRSKEEIAQLRAAARAELAMRGDPRWAPLLNRFEELVRGVPVPADEPPRARWGDALLRPTRATPLSSTDIEKLMDALSPEARNALAELAKALWA